MKSEDVTRRPDNAMTEKTWFYYNENKVICFG